MQKILVTTDYSTNSKAGIRFAIQFASQSPCELVFYNVFEGVEDNFWNPKKGDDTVNSANEIRLEKLKKFVTAIYKESHKHVGKFSCVIETGIDTKNIIQDFAKKNKFDFICISTRGGGILKKILGTTTSSLIQHSPIPVIVVPKNYRLKPIKEIWYSSDLANLKSELTIVQNFAKTFKANVDVYHYDYMIELDEALSKLNKIAAKHITKGTFFHFEKMKIESTISEHLQKDINKHKPSIVVLFTKQNKSWYERLFLRNNTAEVTFDTKTPLLILRKKSS
jgi:nucleotide-binding universal stress UspA family protein